MNQSHLNLQSAAHTLGKLRTMRCTVDPAAGLRVEVGHGPDSRDSISLTVGHAFAELLDALILDQQEAVKYWTEATRRDIRDASDTLVRLGLIP